MCGGQQQKGVGALRARQGFGNEHGKARKVDTREAARIGRGVWPAVWGIQGRRALGARHGSGKTDALQGDLEWAPVAGGGGGTGR